VTAPLAVGIDLGTTHTVLAHAPLEPGAEPRVFAIPQLVSAHEIEARPLLPSVLYALPDGESVPDPWRDAPFVVGEHARRRGQEVTGRAIASSKSWLCHAAVDRTAPILPWGVEPSADFPRLSPVDAAARLLGHVRRAWDAAQPDRPLAEQHVVLTVPASFDQAARQLTLRGAHAAGLEVRLLEEPQAAFYDCMHAGRAELETLADQRGLVLVCDVGGGTTDLTLIRVARDAAGRPTVTRVAVGRHLLLGGDNMDLALAHLVEERLVARPERLDAARFGQLLLACRAAKERLLGDEPPEDAPVALAGRGASLVGSTLSARITREEAERLVVEGFFPEVNRDDRPARRRGGLVAFGLPYEHDPALTRHVAEFFARHAEGEQAPRAVLLNGGVFRARRIRETMVSTLASWSSVPPLVLEAGDPDLAVARGAVVYGLALAGFGPRIGGGSAHGYFVGIEGGEPKRAICVVPRGAQEGERHSAGGRPLALRVGEAVRFELYASDSGRSVPGEVVTIDPDRFERLPEVATRFEGDAASAGGEVNVAVEGELSAIGTLELACVEQLSRGKPRRWSLAFELRDRAGARRSERPAGSVRPDGNRFDQARDAIDRVFGKPREGVREREVKDLWRELERLLGERATFTGELARALFDVVAPLAKARRRSADHERVFWMLAGFCLRPGFGHPRDPERVSAIAPLFEQGLAFQDEARGWQQFWIAWRRIAGGMSEEAQLRIRARIDPFVAPSDEPRKKPKGFRPQAMDEMLELAAALERVPAERRGELGRWLVERTWTDRNPRLWAAIGRIGSRAPVYASVHHVVATKTVERWVEHLLGEKWEEVPTAARAAVRLARVTGDRARDLPEPLRERVAARLERHGSDTEWTRAVRELVPLSDEDRAEFFGEELPVGLRLVE
jgi:molecular chaperone DnaK (HSP70)